MKIVFDLGGVAIQWTPTIFVKDLCKQPLSASERDLIFEAVFQRFAPNSDWSNFDRNAISTQQLSKQISDRILASIPDWSGSNIQVEAWINSLPGRLLPIADTLHWLAKLRAAQIPLYFLSNMPSPFLDTLIRLDHLFDHFEDGIFSCEVGVAKPDREIFELAASRFRFGPSDLIVFIDDHPVNVAAAKSFGWTSIVHRDVRSSTEALNQIRQAENLRFSESR